MLSAVAFVLFCFFCAAMAFVRHPIFGLYFYLASIYVHPPSRWWGYMLPDLRWALLSAGITVLAVAFHRGRLSAKPLWLGNAPAAVLSLYAAWMWLQTLWALDQPTHIEGSTQFVKCLVALWFVYRIVDTTERLRDFLFLHAVGCGLLGIYAQFAGRDGNRLDGVGGPGMDDANTLGAYLATGVIVCMGLFLTQKGWRRWASLGLLAIIVNGFVLANSRGPFLGLAAGVLVLALCKARVHRPLFWSMVLVGTLGSGFIVDKAFVERMFTMGDVVSQDEEADKSARSRVAILEAQVRMARDYPLGAGHRGTAALSTRYLDRQWLTGGGADADAQRSSHNTFMTTLVEQGPPGALMFIALVLWLVQAMLRIRRWNSAAVDPELITLGAAVCGAITVVYVAGWAADYLLAEVQFWMFGALVSALQLGAAAIGPPVGSQAPYRPVKA